MNIAIFSPNKNPYSETFIQAHKQGLSGTVFYYYGIGEEITLENHGRVYSPSGFKVQLLNKLLRRKQKTIWDCMLDSLVANSMDVILVEYGTHAHYLLPLLKRAKTPVVVHFHGYDASMYDILKHVSNYKMVFERANGVIAVSKKMQEMLLEIACPANKLVLNTYGPRDLFLEIEPTFSKKQLIAVGRFTDKKAPYYTVLAFSKIAHKHEDAILQLAGDGELLNSTKNLVKYLGLEKQILFPGVIDSYTFSTYLKESRAFVQHSVRASSGDMEGTPLSVLEASAAGIPVIATRHAGIPDVVLHNETGLLCEEHDVDTMAMHMDTLLTDVARAKLMGDAAKKRIIETFTLDRHLNDINTLFKSLLTE